MPLPDVLHRIGSSLSSRWLHWRGVRWKYRHHSAEAGARVHPHRPVLERIVAVRHLAVYLWNSTWPMQICGFVFFFAGVWDSRYRWFLPTRRTADVLHHRSTWPARHSRNQLPQRQFPRTAVYLALYVFSSKCLLPLQRARSAFVGRIGYCLHHRCQPLATSVSKTWARFMAFTWPSWRVTSCRVDYGSGAGLVCLNLDDATLVYYVLVPASQHGRLAVISIIEQRSRKIEMDDYNGLYQSVTPNWHSLWLSLFSAESPPFAGFFSKFSFRRHSMQLSTLLVFIALVKIPFASLVLLPAHSCKCTLTKWKHLLRHSAVMHTAKTGMWLSTPIIGLGIALLFAKR